MKRWAFLFLTVLGFGALFLSGLLRPVSDGFRRVSLPIVRQLSSWSSRGAQTLFPDKETFQPENLLACEARLRTFIVQDAKLNVLEEENKTLRAQAHFSETSGYDHVGALVIGRVLGSAHARLLIDRGTKDGLEVGQAVITGEGLFIGRILSAETRIATVELITDANSRVSVALAKQDVLVGVLEGRGNGAGVVTFIPSSMDVVADAIIVTAGTEERIPARLPIGIISAVDRRPKDPFYSASLDPLIRFDRVSFVSILRPKALHPSL